MSDVERIVEEEARRDVERAREALWEARRYGTWPWFELRKELGLEDPQS